MPGFNEQQASVDAVASIQQALKDYAQVQQTISRDALAVQAEALKNGFKKPSVFYAHDLKDFTFSYSVQPTPGVVTDITGATTSPTALVIPLRGADKVRIRGQLSQQTQGGSFDLYCYYVFMAALSPRDNLNPIPAYEFFFLETEPYVNAAISGNGIPQVTVFDEIECAGNHYLHILGMMLLDGSGSLMIDVFSSSYKFRSSFSYELIK